MSFIKTLCIWQSTTNITWSQGGKGQVLYIWYINVLMYLKSNSFLSAYLAWLSYCFLGCRYKLPKHLPKTGKMTGNQQLYTILSLAIHRFCFTTISYNKTGLGKHFLFTNEIQLRHGFILNNHIPFFSIDSLIFPHFN